MLQNVAGRDVYIVEFDTMPQLPIIWSTPEEKPYARALQAALEDQVITEPGKYAIQIKHINNRTDYTIYIVKE